MRTALAVLLVGCGPEYRLEPADTGPAAPDLVLAVGDGSLEPDALAPLETEVGRITVRGWDPPELDGTFLRFSVDVTVDTPRGRLGTWALAQATIAVDPSSPHHPVVTVEVIDGDWTTDAGPPIREALERADIGELLVAPAVPASEPPPAPEATPQPPPTDVLFVVDTSRSVDEVLGRIRAAFADMAAVSAFPPDTRVAVTGTTPVDPARRDRPHPAVGNPRWAAHEPGFGRLVDRAGIQHWNHAAKGSEHPQWAGAGCDAWFAPGARDAGGVPCLVAHTQTSSLVVYAEAGLTAFSQLIDADGPLFREGARAHVVFVSDTHDPGVAWTDEKAGRKRHAAQRELLAQRPTGAAVAAQVARTERVASFTLHAIAPQHACTDEAKKPGVVTSYFDAAEATGGHTLDLCDDAAGYAAFLSRALR